MRAQEPTTATAAPTVHAAAPRIALALGMVGALGEELLATLVGCADYAVVHVAVAQPIGSATSRFSPWVPGQGSVSADDAFICIAAPETAVPKGSAMQRVDADAVVAAARTARQCGATQLVVVSPLSALLQLNAAAHTLANEAEVELANLGFTTVVIVRPAADAAGVERGWLAGAVRTMTRMALEIMLPQDVQPLRARTAAAAILEAARRAQPGVHVPGARAARLRSLPKRCRQQRHAGPVCAERPVMRLAIVMPVLDEEPALAATLARLAPLRARGARVIVVDGGSADRSAALAAPLCDHVLAAPRGRAAQMNAGAALALADPATDVLLFVHADTQLPADADGAIERACGKPLAWGRFDVVIEGHAPLLRVIGSLMNLRSRLTGICTGDQAIFATRALFEAIGGFAPLPLMEDIVFSRRARRLARPAALRARVITSGRRWERHGVVRTVLRMWWMRLAYFFGADPARLAATYRDAR